MYKLQNDSRGNEVRGVLRLADNAFIPFETQNVDYQQYLAWVAEGNTPTPAEENQ